MAQSHKAIYWMSSPLAIKEREVIDVKLGRYLTPKLRGYLDPKKEYRFFSKIKHWTLEVDGWCYELLPVAKEKLKMIRVRTDMCKPDFTPAGEWHAFRSEHGIQPERKKVGLTRMTHEEIVAKVNYIWEEFNHGLYLLLVQNCQNFARMLHEIIVLPADDPEVQDAGKAAWESIPEPVSYSLAEFSKTSLAHGGSVGATRLYLASLAPAAEIVESGTIGTIGTTAGGSLSATATTTGEGAGAASTTSGATTQAATTAQTATTGSTHGTAIGAGKASVGTKGVVGGSAGTGKIGLGAKIAGLSQGAMHGAGAAKVATAAKTGAVIAMAHPVTGIAIIGLGALALGKRDKGWLKRHKYGNQPETDVDCVAELSISDVLVAEEELLEQIENPSEKVDRTDEELAEDLGLRLVTTEPTAMLDDKLCHDEMTSARSGTKRSQTSI